MLDSLFNFIRFIFICLVIIAVIYLVSLRLLGAWYRKKGSTVPLVVHLECFATVSGTNGDPVKVQVSARKLPNEGERVKALCKVPTWTPHGFDYDSAEFEWRFVEVRDGKVLIGANS